MAEKIQSSRPCPSWWSATFRGAGYPPLFNQHLTHADVAALKQCTNLDIPRRKTRVRDTYI